MNIGFYILDGELAHYGVGKMDGAPGRGSGRYPLGSGDNPNQHGSKSLLERIAELEKVEDLRYVDEKTGKEYKGEQAIAKIIFGRDGTTTQLRLEKSIASNEERALKVAAARALRDQGLSLNQIAEKMGYENDSSVRSLLNSDSEARMMKAQVTANYLKQMIDEKGMIDVGRGAERELGVSREKLEQALYLLQREGYPLYGGGLPQVTNKGQQTNLKVICPPGTEHKEIYDFDKIHSVKEYDKALVEDGEGIRDKKFYYPESMDSSRLMIRYAEEGGIDKDGVMEIRRGVQDLSLGEAHYAQVRIMVDGTHYLKGMALYSDNLPDGVDVVFNTNKKAGTPMTDVLKKIKNDPDNPFGSLIKEDGGQSFYDDPNGKFTDPVTGKKQSLSLINKRAEEGDWNEWKDKLPSQFLAKQPMPLIERQLYLAETDKKAEFDEIMSYTNPTIKKKLLMSFADDCDAAAVHLQAAALPRQKYKVILPLTDIGDDEVYAPSYKNGEKVALVRFPHEGTYQIPILTVNNKNKEGINVLGTSPKDAIGISSKVAERLSGADFDGDTVMVLPTGGKINIQNHAPLKGLEGFDSKLAYGYTEKKVGADGKEHYYRNGKEFKVMKNTQNEMGKISNLITDMTIRGANEEELARATRHSMVVIDAEKHKLDYKQSEKDNRISELKKLYQKHEDAEGNVRYGGASTLLSRAKGQQSVIKRQGSPRVNQEGKSWYDPSKPEGTLVYKNVDTPTYVDKKTGKEKTRLQKSTQMMETTDARTLSSGSAQEERYAQYANYMKSLANQARMESIKTPNLRYNSSAKIVYAKEVQSLDDKLAVAELNAPRERQAQIIANSRVAAKRKAMEEEGFTKKEIDADLKKVSQRELTQARVIVGASGKDTRIEINDKEWEAIQAGAVSHSKLERILNHTDVDKVKERATPRKSRELSEAKINRIAALKANGYTIEEIANAVGVSSSTVSKYL
jgi:transcriptional regulator with XRE-family HTH domain